MKENNYLQFDGQVIAELGNLMFSVALDTSMEQEVLCTLSGRLRKAKIRVVPGDKVVVDVSPYDLTKGRISYRYGTQMPENNNTNNKKNNKNAKKH